MVEKGTLLKLKKQERELRKRIIVDAARKVFGEKHMMPSVWLK